jgi:pyruvate/2-oxoglutarate dehydrogenase complex dihydrolipoamide acyltransferase (E2) component
MKRGVKHYLTLPDLGLEGRAVVASLWLVRRGSRVAEGDALLEVLAGEATIDLPAPVSGVLVRKLVEENAPLEVGQRLAVIDAEWE